MPDVRPFSGRSSAESCSGDPEQNRGTDGASLYRPYDCTRRHCQHTGRCANEVAGQGAVNGLGGHSIISSKQISIH